MDKYIDAVKIAALISNYFKGHITQEEQLELDEWLNENPLYREWIEKLKEKKGISVKLAEYNHYELEKSWKRVDKATRSNRRWLYRLSGVAAMVMVVLGTFYLLQPTDLPISESAEMIVVGEHKAQLVLSDGSVMNPDTLSVFDLQGGRITKEKNSCLKYARGEKHQDIIGTSEFHQLCVPRGGEYDLILEDGTRVWLNADSKLTFPVVFGEKERKVVLEGEAYFAVSKDVERPFRVMVDGQSLEVLGTEFNVNAYRNEGVIYTTLVEGKVRVTNSLREELVLMPGEQSVSNKDEMLFSKKRVCVEEFISWKSGRFIFEDQNLEQIMRQLERWYDFQVSYQDELLKKIVFQGNIARYEDFEKVLKLLERTGEMRFQVNGKTVVVSK